MCKFLKKLSFSLLGGAFILVSSVGSIAYATEADNEAVYPGGDIMDEKPQTAWEQYLEMLEDPAFSEEECQEFYDRMFTDSKERAKITFKILAVPYCKQETNYYCGPATAQQTVRFYTNSIEESQDDIWKSVGVEYSGTKGTSGDLLKNYVNSKQSTNTYALEYPSSASDMSQDIYSDINRDVPVILWVKVQKGGNWLYSTSGGHFMNASGINTGGSLIEVTDPYIGWVEGHNFIAGKYWVTAEEAYSAITSRGMGYYK